MYGISIRRLRLLHNDHNPADRLHRRGPRRRVVSGDLAALHDERDRWDVLQLSQIPQQSQTPGFMSTLAIADGCATA
jgi:hypothetical protein